MKPPSPMPFVVGQWVRGQRFYGRELPLRRLHGGPKMQWVLAMRRVGKTSLLKQVELETPTRTTQRLAAYWDLQGSQDPADLALGLSEALLDAEETSRALALDPLALSPSDVIPSLRRLASSAVAKGVEVHLLCDEAEALIRLAQDHPKWLRAFAASLDSPGLRCTFVSSVRLQDALAGEPSLAWLKKVQSFFLGPLRREAAGALLRQDHLPASRRPVLADSAVAKIMGCCGCHPLLLQSLAKHFLEFGEVDRACQTVGALRSTHHMFEVDLRLLAPAERSLLVAIARGAEEPAPPDQLARLLSLGLVERRTAGELPISELHSPELHISELHIPNSLLADWLTTLPAG